MDQRQSADRDTFPGRCRLGNKHNDGRQQGADKPLNGIQAERVCLGSKHINESDLYRKHQRAAQQQNISGADLKSVVTA